MVKPVKKDKREETGHSVIHPSIIKMHFSLSNVPKKNPGRYFEQFVKIVQPIGDGGQSGAAQFCNKGAPANKDWSQNMDFQKNPGRCFEQFVRIVQPIGEAGQTTRFQKS